MSLSSAGYIPKEATYFSGWRHRKIAAIIAFLGMLCACAPDLPPLPPEAAGPYRLGPGDVVRLIIVADQQVTESFVVSDGGNLAIPLLGKVRAEGLSVEQLESSISEQLIKKGFYRSPSVTAEITTYRPIFVLGEVTKPGQYPYQPGMTVLTAVAIAGGFTYRAVQDSAEILRKTSEQSVDARADPSTLVKPGDVVKILESRF